MRRTGCGSSRPTGASAPAGWPRPSARARWRPTASCASLGVRAPRRATVGAGEPGGPQDAQAYADGINADLRQQLRARPPEFLILGLQPEPWTPRGQPGLGDHDGLGPGRQLEHRTAAHAAVDADAGRAHPPAAAALSRREAPGDGRLRGAVPAAGSAATADRPARRLCAHDLPWVADPAWKASAPNNWVVAGSRTTTGKPLLANDPHLKLSAPALWYFARIEAPGCKVAGATMPGLPVVVLGQNEHIAWGFTNTGARRAGPLPRAHQARRRAALPRRPRLGPLRDDRGDDPGQGRARCAVHGARTRHGPVMSATPASPTADGPERTERPAGLRAGAALDGAGRRRGGHAGARLAMSTAPARWTSSSGPRRDYVAPMQNMVVADAPAASRMVAPAACRCASPRTTCTGLVPAPGWDARYDWAGFVPADETPRELDPARGWIATANQRIHAPDYPHFITSEWALPYRQQRIEQMLAARPQHALDAWRPCRPTCCRWRDAAAAAVAAAGAQRPSAGRGGAASSSRASTARMAADRAAPLIFWAWVRQLTPACLPTTWARIAGAAAGDAQLP